MGDMKRNTFISMVVSMDKQRWEEIKPQLSAVIESALERYRKGPGLLVVEDAQKIADLLEMGVNINRKDNPLHFCAMVQLRISQLQMTYG